MEPDRKLDNIISSITNTFKLALQFGSNENANMNVYKDMVNKLCDIENNTSKSKEMILTLQQVQTMEEFDEIYSTLETQNNINPKNSIRFQNFEQNVNEIFEYFQDNQISNQNTRIQNNISIDGMNMIGTISDVDPLTKKPLENPVRNALCGHIYGKDSVVESLQTNPRLRCPIVGCGNNQYIQLQHLIEDNDIAKQLQTQRNHTNGMSS